MKKKIGIMGGTFDPIHNGHLILAEHSRLEFNLDKILFIPTGNPPHKELKKVSDKSHRYQMTLLAINSNPHFYISSIEVEKDYITYTVDTIESLLKIYKDTEIYFILGADSFCNIHLWKDYKKLLSLCHMIVLNRLDTEEQLLNKKIKSLKNNYEKSIHILESALIEISSTDIRNRVENNLSTKYLIPEAVEFYINKNRLYK